MTEEATAMVPRARDSTRSKGPGDAVDRASPAAGGRFPFRKPPARCGQSPGKEGREARLPLPVPVLALAAALALPGACRHPAAEPEDHGARAHAGGTLRVLQEDPGTFDPVLVNDVYEAAVTNQIYEGLVELDPLMGVRPSLARSWVIGEGGRLYRFLLRDSLRFHDGSALTSRDVQAALQRALDPRGGCLAETYLRGIDGAAEFQAGRAPAVRGIWTEGDNILCIRLGEPLSFFLSVLCMDQLKIQPARLAGAAESLRVIGTGPFAYRGRSGGTITLARHASYWGGPALLDSLQFVASTDLAPDDQVAALLEGDVDVISVPSTRRSLLGDAAGYTIVRSVDIGVSFIGLNLDISPLDRLEVRQALAMGLDRPSLVAPEAAGELQLAKGVLPPVLTGYNPEPKVLPCDPQAARARLKDAGYDERHPLPPIDFYTSISSSSWLTDHVRDQLADIGVTVRVHQVTWPELDGRITRGEAPMFTLSWVADVPDPDAFLYFLFRTGEPYNVCRFSDREVDSLLALGRRMVPGPERSAMYRRVEEQVLRLAPMIPLYHAESVYAISPGVEGLELSQFGFALAPFERVWIRQPLLAQQPSAEGTLR